MFDSSLQRIREITGVAERQQELSARVARLTPFDGTHQSVLPSLALTRKDAPTAVFPTVYQPCLGIVVQGRKCALLNGEVFHYDALNYLVVSVTLPGMGQVLEATPEHPYLSLRLNLDLKEIARLVLELEDRGTAPAATDRGLFVARLDEPLLDAVLRMVKLLDTPEDIWRAWASWYSALFITHFARRTRLSDWSISHRARGQSSRGAGHRVAQTALCEPVVHRGTRRRRAHEPLALHHRFQPSPPCPRCNQKHLRLHEARRLMFADGIESAAPGTGGLRASQFSREYRRLFGAPPRSEIARLRELGAVGVAPYFAAAANSEGSNTDH